MKAIKNIFTIATCLLVLGSCKKDLDIKPTGTLEETKTFTNVADLEKGLLAVYATIDGENNITTNALLSDELKLSSKNLGQSQTEFKYQFNSANESFGFDSHYATINRANRILTILDGIPATTPADVTKKDQIKSELLAIRAYCHFELLQRFAPAYTPAATGISNVSIVVVTEKLSRQTVAENLTFIEADLTAAKAGQLPTAPVPAANGSGNIRISKAFVAGVQARVALYKKDWSNASTYATEAINFSALPLATRTQFASIWTDGSSTTITNETEVFFRLRRSGSGLGQFFSSPGNTIVYFEPSDKLKNQFDRSGADIRFPTYFLTQPTGDTSLVKKYYISARGERVVDVKVMRTSEMYLIRAEAKASLPTPDLTGAAADINALRSNRISPYTNITYTDPAVALNDILIERQKELCYEGFRLFDLKRKGLGVNRLASDVQSPNWQTIAPTDTRFQTLPIPQSELQFNPAYGQNPGY